MSSPSILLGGLPIAAVKNADGTYCLAAAPAPVEGVAPITASDTAPVTPGRSLVVVATVAGNVKVGFPDGSTLIVPVVVGFTKLDFAVAKLYATGTTATASYAIAS